jgi:hypothetical protein
MERVSMAGKPGDPDDDLELDPPLPNEDEPEDLQDQELVEDEADEQSEPDQPDASQQQQEPERQAREQPSRGDRRFQTMANELQEQRRRNDDLNRRLDALLAGQAQPRPQGETPEARAQRQSLMTPEERIREDMNLDRQNFANEIQQMRFATLDGNDRAAYQAKATVDPLYKKWETKVEAELATLRNQGMNADREKIMFYLIGKAGVEGRQANGPRQRAEAQQRVRRAQTRPTNSGSDIAPRRSRGDSLERRLENQEL